MKKKYTLAILVSVASNLLFFAQVGINNILPQQTLHISGTGSGVSQSIVRIDGLAESQNPAHENSTSFKRIFATGNGDLVILNNNQTNKYYTSPAFTPTAVPGGTERPVTNYSFTLDYPSVVHVEARTGVTITSPIGSGSDPIMRNGQARSFGTYFKFTAAPTGISTNTAFGESVMSYGTLPGGEQMNGLFYVEPRKDLYLPKGNYTVVLYGFSGDTNMNIAINDISQPNQQMRVSITPVTY